MRVAVTGGRDYADRDAVFETLDLARVTLGIDALCHGACEDFRATRRAGHLVMRGADRWADAWCVARGVPVSRYPAHWTGHHANAAAATFDRGAGMRRNAAMLRDFQPDVLIAFPGGNGTAHCVGVARKLGVCVLDLRGLLATMST